MFKSLKNAIKANRSMKKVQAAVKENKLEAREAKAHQQKEDLIKSSDEVRRSQERLKEANENMNNDLDWLKEERSKSNSSLLGDCMRKSVDGMDKR